MCPWQELAGSPKQLFLQLPPSSGAHCRGTLGTEPAGRWASLPQTSGMQLLRDLASYLGPVTPSHLPSLPRRGLRPGIWLP